ncbi:Fe2+-enterobactin ABC transporter substrate-binding protein [Marinomonas mediterranea]|jgi:ABC-type Fe2+-enterobactin transport system, periplasmic component|uniref:ABC-type transporter, periplasmic subunit n=1 Tax=Marinomonas mediterranea (strain ATCC 700492 / JCM 21426 / NBRC 103028 / MMB-1) TaxID=717774 RepID=F2JZU2_MARM1|nr:Fe2+-enterobactin ABC transporter substrate-binding protein [Marinomonas mediterranea]ADZ92054.1 ABC-type transporter, periplasmic subunit [Marinomonas mediterranea MMB-1]
MPTTRTPSLKHALSSALAKLALAMITSLALSACEHSESAGLKVDDVTKDPSGWPRTLMTSKGPVTLDAPPKRIVSTSVTMTGTLLAIKAPVIASGGTVANTSVADRNGFMRQWSDIADKQNLVSLYQREPDAEAIVAQHPDLILISATGGDSARKLYDQLKSIAPTAIIRYDNKSWMQLATLLGDFLGKEDNAKSVITEFESKVQHFKETVTLPAQPTTAMVYYADGTGANIWTDKSAQGRLLKALGFSLAILPESVKGDISMGKRSDIVIATGERLPDAVTGNTLLLFSAEKEQEKKVKSNSYLKDIPAVQQDAVYAVGNDTFRMDYYSASNLIDRLSRLFKEKHANASL